MKLDKGRYFYLLILIIFGFLPLIAWFEEEYLVCFSDWFPPINPWNSINENLFIWNSSRGVTFLDFASIFPLYPFWAFFRCLGISSIVIQKIWAIFTFLLPALSMYYFSSIIFPDEENNLAKFITSFFYMFNITVVTNIFSTTNSSAYIIIPLLLAFLIKGFKTGQNKYVILFGLTSFLFSAHANNPRTFGIVWIIITSYFIYHLFFLCQKKVERSSCLLFFGKIIGLYTIFSLPWIISVFSQILIPFSSQAASLTKDINLEWVLSHTRKASLLNVFRMLGVWSWGRREAYYPYSVIYWSPLIIITTYSISLLAFSALLLKRNDKKVIFFTILAVIAIFLAKGLHPPLAAVNKFIYLHIPGFILFRDPLQVFKYIIVFCYAVLMSITVNEIYKYILKKGKGIYFAIVKNAILPICTLIILVSAWPLVTGDFLIRERPTLSGYFVKIPHYYFQASNWINNQKNDFKIFPLPLAHSVHTHYNWGYLGVDRIPLFFRKPVIISRAGYIEYGNIAKLQGSVSKVLFSNSKNLYKILKLLNTKYILQRNDFDWTYFGTVDMGSPEKMKSILNSQEKIYLEKSFGELDFYKISDEYFLPPVYLSPTSTLANSNIESLAPMAETKYLGGKPVLVFTEQGIGRLGDWRQEIGRLGAWERNATFVFKDSIWRDLAVEMAGLEKWEIKKDDWKVEEVDEGESYLVWQEKFRLKSPGVYELWFDYGERESWGWEIKVDGEDTLQFEIPEEFYSKYLKIARIDIEDAGKHLINIKYKISNNKTIDQNLRIILVSKEERQRAEEFIWKKMNQSDSKTSYIFSQDGEFYVP